MKIGKRLLSYLLAGVMTITSVFTTSVMMSIPAAADSVGLGSVTGYYTSDDWGVKSDPYYAIAIYLCEDPQVTDGPGAHGSTYDIVKDKVTNCATNGIMANRSKPIFYFPNLDDSVVNAYHSSWKMIESFDSDTANCCDHKILTHATVNSNPGLKATIGTLAGKSFGDVGPTLHSGILSYRKSIEYDRDKEFKQIIEPLFKELDSTQYDKAYKLYLAEDDVTIIVETYIKIGDNDKGISNSDKTLWLCYHASESYGYTGAEKWHLDGKLNGTGTVNFGYIGIWGASNSVKFPFKGGTLLEPGWSTEYKLDSTPRSIPSVSEGVQSYQAGWAYFALCNNHTTKDYGLVITKDIIVDWAPDAKDEDKGDLSLDDIRSELLSCTVARFAVSPLIIAHVKISDDKEYTNTELGSVTATELANILYADSEKNSDAMAKAVSLAQSSNAGVKALYGDKAANAPSVYVGSSWAYSNSIQISTKDLTTGDAIKFKNLDEGEYYLFLYESGVSGTSSKASIYWEKPYSGIIVRLKVARDDKNKLRLDSGSSAHCTRSNAKSTLEFLFDKKDGDIIYTKMTNKAYVPTVHVEPPAARTPQPYVSILDVDDYWLTGYDAAAQDKFENLASFGYTDDKQHVYTHSALVNAGLDKPESHNGDRSPYMYSWVAQGEDVTDKGLDDAATRTRVLELLDENDSEVPLAVRYLNGGTGEEEWTKVTGSEYTTGGAGGAGGDDSVYYYDFAFVNPASASFTINRKDFYKYSPEFVNLPNGAEYQLDPEGIDPANKTFESIGISFELGSDPIPSTYYYTLSEENAKTWFKDKYFLKGSPTVSDEDPDNGPWKNPDPVYTEKLLMGTAEVELGATPSEDETADATHTTLPKGGDVAEGDEGVEIKADATGDIAVNALDFTKAGKFTAEEINKRLVSYSDYAKAYSAYESLIMTDVFTLKNAAKYWTQVGLQAYKGAKDLLNTVGTIGPDRSGEQDPTNKVVSGYPTGKGWASFLTPTGSQNKFRVQSTDITNEKQRLADLYTASAKARAEEFAETIKAYSSILERATGWKLEYCIPYAYYAKSKVSNKNAIYQGKVSYAKKTYTVIYTYKAPYAAHDGTDSASFDFTTAISNKTFTNKCEYSISITNAGGGGNYVTWTGASHEWDIYSKNAAGQEYKSGSGSDPNKTNICVAPNVYFFVEGSSAKKYDVKSDNYSLGSKGGICVNVGDATYMLNTLRAGGTGQPKAPAYSEDATTTGDILVSYVIYLQTDAGKLSTNSGQANAAAKKTAGGYVGAILERKFEYETKLRELELNRPHAEIHIYSTYEAPMQAPYKTAEVEEWLLSMYWKTKAPFLEENTLLASVVDGEPIATFDALMKFGQKGIEVDAGNNTEDGEYLARRDREKGSAQESAVFSTENGTLLANEIFEGFDGSPIFTSTNKAGKDHMPGKLKLSPAIDAASDTDLYHPVLTFHYWSNPLTHKNKEFQDGDIDTLEFLATEIFQSGLGLRIDGEPADSFDESAVSDPKKIFHFGPVSYTFQEEWGISIPALRTAKDSSERYTHLDARAYGYLDYGIYATTWSIQEDNPLNRVFPADLVQQAGAADSSGLLGNISDASYGIVGVLGEDLVHFEDGDELRQHTDADFVRMNKVDVPSVSEASNIDEPVAVVAGSNNLPDHKSSFTAVYDRFMRTLFTNETRPLGYWMWDEKSANFSGMGTTYKGVGYNWYLSSAPNVITAKFLHYIAQDFGGPQGHIDDATGIDHPQATIFQTAWGAYSRDDDTELWAVYPLVKMAYYREDSRGDALTYTYVLGQQERKFYSNVFYRIGVQGTLIPIVQVNQQASATETGATNLQALENKYKDTYSGGNNVPVTYSGTGITVQYDASQFYAQIQTMNFLNKDAEGRALDGDDSSYQSDWSNKTGELTAHQEVLKNLGADISGDKVTIPYAAATDMAIVDGMNSGSWVGKGIDGGLETVWTLKPNQMYKATEDTTLSWSGRILLWAEQGEITRIFIPDDIMKKADGSSLDASEMRMADESLLAPGDFRGKTTAETVSRMCTGKDPYTGLDYNNWIRDGMSQLGLIDSREICKEIFEHHGHEATASAPLAEDKNENLADKLSTGMEGSPWYDEYCYILALDVNSTAFRLPNTAVTDKIPVECGPTPQKTVKTDYFKDGYGLRADKVVFKIGNPSIADFHGMSNITNSSFVVLTRYKYPSYILEAEPSFWTTPAGQTYVDVIVSDVPTTATR